MNLEKNHSNPVCANPGCAHPVEPGERFCDACGLEWLLYRRDLRVKSGVKSGTDPDFRPQPR